MYEIRVGLNQLEQDLLQTHLKCCISPNIKIPGEVVLALSRLSEKRHGVIIAIEHRANLDDGKHQSASSNKLSILVRNKASAMGPPMTTS